MYIDLRDKITMTKHRNPLQSWKDREQQLFFVWLRLPPQVFLLSEAIMAVLSSHPYMFSPSILHPNP